MCLSWTRVKVKVRAIDVKFSQTLGHNSNSSRRRRSRSRRSRRRRSRSRRQDTGGGKEGGHRSTLR